MPKILKLNFICLIIVLSACAINVKDKAQQDVHNAFDFQNIIFGKMEGLNQNSVNNLQQIIANYAPSYGFFIKNSKDALVLQGYFSFERNSDNKEIVYYVFDLLNREGQRFHRVYGRLGLANNKSNFLKDEDYKEISSQLFLALKQWRLRLSK